MAYDPVNDVYLVITGPLLFPGTISGHFVQGDGTPVGPFFQIPQTTTHCQSPRVSYSSDLGGFLVVWLDTRADQVHYTAQVWGRLVKFSAGGNPVLPGSDLFIDNATGSVNPEIPPVVACAGGLNECLVAWHQYGGLNGEGQNDVHAVRVNATTGQLAGAEQFLSNDNDFQGMPAVAYDPVAQMYLVAYSYYNNAALFAQARVQRVSAGSDGLIGPPIPLVNSVGVFTPDVSVNTITNQFYVTWWDGPTRTFFGRYVGPDGSLGSMQTLLVGYGGNDAFGISYNVTTGTFFAVTHGLATEDVGFQIMANGTPQAPFDTTFATGDRKGNYWPRVTAAPQREQWLVATSTDFVVMSGTLIGTSERSGVGPGGGGGGTPPPPTTIDLTPTGAPNGSWFLAEGVANSQGNGFKTFYLIENPNPVDVSVRAYFSNTNGVATLKTFTVPASSRTSLSLIDQVGEGTFGAVFQSLSPGADIEVERSVYWGPNLEGSTDATATKTLSDKWYFAEGSRGGELFNNYYLLFNPTQNTIQVTGNYFRADGTVTGHTYNLAPQQRISVDANVIPELAGTDFAATFTGTGGAQFVAERSMYWGWTGANLWIGGHATMGASALSTQWMFAEGNAAPNFESFFLLLNPNAFPITVEADFLTEFSGQKFKTYVIPANTRLTVYLNGEFGNIGPSGAIFTSADTSAFLAERSIYWGNRVEGTNTIGGGSANAWDLPEGSTTGSFDTYEMVMNPNGHDVAIDMTLFIEGVGKFTLPAASRPIIPAGSRKTFNMKDILSLIAQQAGLPATLQNSSFSTRIAVPGGTDRIVVEHAIYWNYIPDGVTFWRSGGASMGIPH